MRKTTFDNTLPDGAHQFEQERDIVQADQPNAEQFLRAEQVMNIGARIATARIAVTQCRVPAQIDAHYPAEYYRRSFCASTSGVAGDLTELLLSRHHQDLVIYYFCTI